MIPKLKLIIIGTAILILTYRNGYCQIDTLKNVDSTSIIVDQTKKTTEWKEKAPTAEGWQNVRPGMTIDELSGAIPGEDFRTKKVKYRKGATGQEARLKKKVVIDGLDYQVSFFFDSSGHLITIAFRCDSKVKKETTSNVVASFTGLLGDPTKKETNSTTDGTLGQSLSHDLESYTWKQTNTTLRVLSVTMRSHLIVTARFIIVSMNYSGDKDDI